jgi:L-amino acid N-acyltransferase YncA
MSLPANLLVRDARLGDAPAIAAIYAPYVRSSAVTFELEPPDVTEVERRMRSVLDGGLPYIVAETKEGEAAGYAYAGPFRPRKAYRFTVEDMVYLREEFVGRGVGRQMLSVLIDRCRAADLRQMVAVIGGEDPASVEMHRRLGFVEVGILHRVGFKFGEWHDVTLMQLGL